MASLFLSAGRRRCHPHAYGFPEYRSNIFAQAVPGARFGMWQALDTTFGGSTMSGFQCACVVRHRLASYHVRASFS